MQYSSHSTMLKQYNVKRESNILNALLLTNLLFFLLVFSVFSFAKPAGNLAWKTTFAAPMQKYQLNAGNVPTLNNQTVRNIVRISKGGNKFRIRVANTYGDQPLALTAASVAIPVFAADVQQPVSVTFGGLNSVSIPVGSDVYSDPIQLTVADDSDLAVSLYFDSLTGLPTVESNNYKDSYVGSQDQTLSTQFQLDHSVVANPFNYNYFLRAVEVEAPKQTVTIATIGASITDGFMSTKNANATYPNRLSARLHALAKYRKSTVVNLGIGGNRLLDEMSIFGSAALARVDSDVIALSKVTHMVFLQGVNDIALPEIAGFFPNDRVNPVTAEQVIFGITQMAYKAQSHGIKFIVGTLLPYEGAIYYTPAGNDIRLQVNAWIRTTNVIDGFVDFDAALRDPNAVFAIEPSYNSGDNLHPNDAGYQAMANAFDLKLFK